MYFKSKLLINILLRLIRNSCKMNTYIWQISQYISRLPYTLYFSYSLPFYLIPFIDLETQILLYLQALSTFICTSSFICYSLSLPLTLLYPYGSLPFIHPILGYETFWDSLLHSYTNPYSLILMLSIIITPRNL